MGNEVIAVDSDMDEIERMKDKVTYAICLDTAEPNALTGLPLKNTDVAIVCIGEDQGANIMTTATLMNLNVKRVISRSINTMHENVLHAIGVTEIVRPEEETAERWAKKLDPKNVSDSFEQGKDYSTIEVIVPQKLIGKSIEEVSFRNTFNLLVLCIIKNKEEHGLIGKSRMVKDVQRIPDPKTKLEEGDILVVYGADKDIKSFAGIR